MSNINNFAAPEFETPPPEWAQTFNTSFSAVDGHDHTFGKGLQLSFDVINFTNSFNCPILLNLNQLNFSGVTPTINQTVYSDGQELFTRDGFGREIKITAHGNLNVLSTTGGGFSGDYVSSNAQVIYDSVTNTYNFKGPAGVDFSDLRVGLIDEVKNFVLPKLVDIADLEVTCPSIVGNFHPVGTNTGFVITGNPVNGDAVDLAPFVQLTSVNTASKQSNYFFSAVPPTLNYYGIFQRASVISVVQGQPLSVFNSLQQFSNRNDVNTDTFNLILQSPALVLAYGGFYGGVSQSAPVCYISGRRGIRIEYSDNLILESEVGDNFWNNDLVLAMKFFGIPL